jgi:hypothetical protein
MSWILWNSIWVRFFSMRRHLTDAEGVEVAVHVADVDDAVGDGGGGPESGAGVRIGVAEERFYLWK